jgi:hypothetical protein
MVPKRVNPGMIPRKKAASDLSPRNHMTIARMAYANGASVIISARIHTKYTKTHRGLVGDLEEARYMLDLWNKEATSY